jgi:hypothetical protein
LDDPADFAAAVLREATRTEFADDQVLQLMRSASESRRRLEIFVGTFGAEGAEGGKRRLSAGGLEVLAQQLGLLAAGDRLEALRAMGARAELSGDQLTRITQHLGTSYDRLLALLELGGPSPIRDEGEFASLLNQLRNLDVRDRACLAYARLPREGYSPHQLQELSRLNVTERDLAVGVPLPPGSTQQSEPSHENERFES